MNSEKNKYVLIDFIFSIVKMNKDIPENAIMEKYEFELGKLSCDQKDLKKILSKLETDGKIYMSDDGFRVAPNSSDFKGYYLEELETGRTTNVQNRREVILRIIPIVLSLIFGVTTIYFSYTNREKDKKIKEKDDIIQKQIKDIDSLKKH